MTGKSGRYLRRPRQQQEEARGDPRPPLRSTSHLLKAKTLTIRTNRLVKISTRSLRVPKATKKVNVRVLRVR